jgi:hypothetical protein
MEFIKEKIADTQLETARKMSIEEIVAAITVHILKI